MSGMQGLINAQLMMAVYLGVGALCRRLGYMDDHVEDKLTSAVISIALPCMIFNAMLSTLGDVVLSDILQVVLACIVLLLGSYILGKIIYRNSPADKKPVFVYSVLSSNSAFVGLPIIGAVYGDYGIFFAAVYMTVARLFVWTLGLNLFIRGSAKQVLRRIATNPNNIAVALAVLVHCLHIPIPGVILEMTGEIGGTSTLLCMVMVGSLIAGNLHWKKLLDKDAYLYSLIRLIVIPLLTLGMLRLLGVPATATGTIVIMAAAPAPTLACVMASRYGADKELAALLVLVSTVISFITQPLMALLCL